MFESIGSSPSLIQPALRSYINTKVHMDYKDRRARKVHMALVVRRVRQVRNEYSKVLVHKDSRVHIQVLHTVVQACRVRKVHWDRMVRKHCNLLSKLFKFNIFVCSTIPGGET